MPQYVSGVYDPVPGNRPAQGGGVTDSGFDPRAFTGQTFLPPEKQQAFATLNEFLRDPLQNIAGRMGPLLRSLVPSEQSARQGLLDQYRRAGGLRSGAFAQGARQLEGDIFGRRAETATRASLGALAPIMGGYQTALTGIPALERRQEILPTNVGGRGGAGGGSDFGGFGFGFSNPPLPPGYNANYGYAGGRAPGGLSGPQYGTGELSGASNYDPLMGYTGGQPAYFDPTAFDYSGGEGYYGGGSSSPFDYTGGEQQYNWGGFSPGIYD